MNNPYIETDKNNIISFTLCKLEKNKDKHCKCKNPHYELDAVNRIVTCTDCGAVLDAFDALTQVAKRMALYADYQQQARDKVALFRELANKESRRRFKNSIFKTMEEHYLKNNCHPHCPKCNEAFDPIKIYRWSRAKLEGEDVHG